MREGVHVSSSAFYFLYDCLTVYVNNVHTHDDTLRLLSLNTRVGYAAKWHMQPSRIRIEKLDICLVKRLFLVVNGSRTTYHSQWRESFPNSPAGVGCAFTGKQRNQTRVLL
jgi:hypothetical protein